MQNSGSIHHLGQLSKYLFHVLQFLSSESALTFEDFITQFDSIILRCHRFSHQ